MEVPDGWGLTARGLVSGGGAAGEGNRKRPRAAIPAKAVLPRRRGGPRPKLAPADGGDDRVGGRPGHRGRGRRHPVGRLRGHGETARGALRAARPARQQRGHSAAAGSVVDLGEASPARDAGQTFETMFLVAKCTRFPAMRRAGGGAIVQRLVDLRAAPARPHRLPRRQGRGHRPHARDGGGDHGREGIRVNLRGARSRLHAMVIRGRH